MYEIYQVFLQTHCSLIKLVCLNKIIHRASTIKVQNSNDSRQNLK